MLLSLMSNAEEEFNSIIFEKLYKLRQLWNTVGEFWTLDILDEAGNVLVLGVKIIAGELLLQQYPHIPFDLKSENSFDPVYDDLANVNLEVINKNV